MSITKVILDNLSGTEQQDVPFTFGQVFAQGDLPVEMSLEGLQVDAKAFHADGSVRHAVVSGFADLPASGSQVVELVAAERTAVRASINKVTPPVEATVQITINGEAYTADYKVTDTLWLDGPIVTEVHSSMPLTKAGGVAHPHLHARFAMRTYNGTPNARVDITVENNWAYEPNPQNFTYDVSVLVNSKEVYSKKSLTHLHHSRWRKVVWTNAEPQVHIRHDTVYLINSRALPNYDYSLVIPEKVLSGLMTKWEGPKTEPMGVGLALAGMATTGGRWDIGLLPGWAAMYLLSMDARAKKVTMGTADLAGSWSSHYRDKNTDLPISVIDYPYMTIAGNPGDTRNPVTKKLEAFPVLNKETSKLPHNWDVSHQPAFAYLPYVVTGDYYYLEELQFWAMVNVLSTNPGYRNNVEGLIKSEQVRGQAWTLRTLGEAAYITPDSHPLKSHFKRILASNLKWYNSEYSNNPNANKLGVIVNGYSLGYLDGTAVGPWQDDFFTAAVGSLVEKGFNDAEPLLRYKAKFPTLRMVGEGASYLAGANYTYTIRKTKASPFYETIKEAFVATVGEAVAALPLNSPEMAKALGRKDSKDMGGYSDGTSGYPSNMQPALAYAASTGPQGRGAWEQFMARSIKPDYREGPQFAILPRMEGVPPPEEEVVPEIPPVAVPPVETPPIVVPPVIPPIVVEPTPEPTPVPVEPVKEFVPHINDIISVGRDGATHDTTMSALIELIVKNITVELTGKLVVQKAP